MRVTNSESTFETLFWNWEATAAAIPGILQFDDL
jgi:hypothetical protein